ncbi:MAG: histidinol-phosphate transaminase [Flavobacterium sp.]|uniref:histidinol-phosphate transaminase n=1 Tax=Flavobacterium sp. TaxID=239 RepID=UPI0012205710|nr:histidinol-phosphate transaminase [Flavobacterium sp.]RZJ66235.1 MAG: histidinol-phosphate transaminase [Flavobacterium sp.]
MFDVKNYIRQNVLKLESYSSARDEFGSEASVFLDANENPFGSLNRYPDPKQTRLKQRIAELKGLYRQSIFVGNGSDEAIDLCFRIFCEPGKSEVLSFGPTYGMYKVSAAINDVGYSEIELNDVFQIDFGTAIDRLENSDARLLFLCSPNNPTGNGIVGIEKILSAFKGIVVIDEAYIDFSDEPSWAKRIYEFPNLIVLQTFSKAFGLAAARVGIAISNPEIISWFDKVKPPYNVSSLNQDAVLKRLIDVEKVNSEIEILKVEREKLMSALAEIPSIEKIFPSQANFILIRIDRAESVYEKLIDLGIVVRKRTSQIPNALRITVGTPQENLSLIQTLKQIT